MKVRSDFYNGQLPAVGEGPSFEDAPMQSGEAMVSRPRDYHKDPSPPWRVIVFRDGSITREEHRGRVPVGPHVVSVKIYRNKHEALRGH